EEEARAAAADLLDEARERHREALQSAEEVVRYEAELRADLDGQVAGLREILHALERQRGTLPGPPANGRPRQLLIPVPPPEPEAEAAEPEHHETGEEPTSDSAPAAEAAKADAVPAQQREAAPARRPETRSPRQPNAQRTPA
ncbi:hypothetical protein AB0J52_28855, partial [Spirillospora sp. NPDC049652]